MSLPKKYEPEVIEEFEGNSALKNSLGALLKRKREDFPHVLLFSGAPGCGKTTLGNIVGRELGCDMEFEYNEVNASDFKGIEMVRDLRDQIRYKPMSGKCRIWHLDEAHKMTGDAQNALLKMLEPKNIPKHVYFIFTTTDPQKLLAPLRQRCTTFEVKPLEDYEMLDYLEYICEKEKAKVPNEVLKKIVKDGGGSPRNTLQILERIIDLPTKEMAAAAEQMDEAETQTIDLCRILLKPKVKWAEVAKALSTHTGEPESTRYAILGYCSSILLKGTDNPKAALIMDCMKEPTYNTGKPGLVLMCYQAIVG